MEIWRSSQYQTATTQSCRNKFVVQWDFGFIFHRFWHFLNYTWCVFLSCFSPCCFATFGKRVAARLRFTAASHHDILFTYSRANCWKCCRLSLASKCHHMFLSSGENSRSCGSVSRLGAATVPPSIFNFLLIILHCWRFPTSCLGSRYATKKK